MNVIVGGGWSGLAAALELSIHDRPVTLLESAATLGGRARRIEYRGSVFDNGQHLLIGACTAVRYLHRRLGLAESDLFDRRPFELVMYSPDKPPLRLQLPSLPAPLHLVAGLLRASGLGIADRLRALRLYLALRRPRHRPDCSIADLLARHRQSPRLNAALWKPLCVAILNTAPQEASAELLGRVLRDAFSGQRSNSDLLIPRTDLGRLLPEPAQRCIEARGGRILLRHRATGLETAGDRIVAVICGDGGRIPVGRLILALPPAAALRLMRPYRQFAKTIAALENLEAAPIVTVYLEYPEHISLPRPLIGFAGMTAQWAFDHAAGGHPGRIAVVIGGHGDHLALDDATIIARVGAELAACFSGWPAPATGVVLREKRATFACRPGIDSLRPGIDTGFVNCWLAGDAVATGYPATLEGAARSGIACARRVLSDRDRVPIF